MLAITKIDQKVGKLKKKKKENNVFQLLGSEKPMISRSRPHPENQFNGCTHNLNGSTVFTVFLGHLKFWLPF